MSGDDRPLPVTLLGWREKRSGALVGFAEIQLGALRIKDVSVFQMGDKRWANMPARPRIVDGKVLTEAGGRWKYDQIIEWSSRQALDRFTAGVIAAIQAKHPDAFPDAA